MASNSICILVFLLFLPVLYMGVATAQIKLGSTISPRSTYPKSWPSLSGQFKFGFYDQDNGGFAIGIWLVGNGGKITVVWTANREDPPISLNATLILDNDGKLHLTETTGGQQKLIANTAYSATSASMLDNGNFVLYNNSFGHVIWQSFDYPTDTILGGQILSCGAQLFSSVSETNRSTGRFHLKMQDDGNLVLYPINNEDTSRDAYWSSDTYHANGFKFHLYLNYSNGYPSIVNGTQTVTILQSGYSSNYQDDNYTKGTIFRATLNANGIFRIYSHAPDSNGKLKEPVTLWSAIDNLCEVKGFCGLNSYCTFFDDQPNCLCIPGTDFVDVNMKTLGCLKNYSDAVCTTNGKENITLYGMYEAANIMWEDIGYVQAEMSLQECNYSCLQDCNCGAAIFEGGYCTKQKFPLKYVKRDIKESTTAFFKVGKSTTSIRNESDSETKYPNLPPRSGSHFASRNDLIQILVLPLCLVIFSCVSIAISCLYISKIRVLRYKRLKESKGQFGLTDDQDLTLRVFSYNELKRATNGFKEELGRGSFGAVYKGALNKGRKLVAVKRLEKLMEEGEREFKAEMRAIGRTNHKNLVRLMGYCAEDSKRLLVYEYMSNGSLADLLFKQVKRPYWEERVRIAVDVAKGINYLHEECKTPIIHCDVKPQNILMDDFWTAKISDFGLAKLLMPDQTRTFTGIRGTRGYLAPEWHQNSPITVKADVYSYGIVLLEIICCRRNLEVNVPNAEEIVLSNWVYKCFAARELDKLVVGEEADRRTLEKMVKVGIWCIQDEAVLRPSMKSVVLMLEGITDISAPPCPTSATSM